MPKTSNWPRPIRHAVARLNDFLSPSGDVDFLGNRNAPIAPATPPPENIEGKRERPDGRQFGASGTPIMSGFISDMQEYNPELRGRNAFPIYEQMRRTDADVAGLLLACKLPIRSAQFQIVPGADQNEPEYAFAQEIADFVKECLFGGLEYQNANGVNFSQRFESVIENALLCLEFGCSGHEDLWRIDGDRIRLRKIAPRLPMTFYQFIVEPDGETLQSIVQWGYRGSQWVTTAIPANKFTLFSLGQEGANFYGRSILRPIYPHWFMKQGLYRIDSIACERNGMGIPVITMGEQVDTDSRDRALQWTEMLTANEATSLTLPFGWKLELVAVSGKVKDLIPSIQHQSEMICRAGLAMFMSLGSSQTGSRALGNVMVDFFQLSEEAMGKFICDTITETTIRRLVDFNYARTSGKPLPYPRLVIPNIAVLNPLDIMTALKDAGDARIDFLQPDDETENWLRKKIGMPMKSTEGARPRFAPVADRIQSDESGTPQEIEAGKGAPIAKKPAPALKPADPKKKDSELSKVHLSDRVTRDLMPHELKHNFDGHWERQDKTQNQIRRILAGALPGLIRNVATRAAMLPPEHLESLTVPLDRALIARLTNAIELAHKYGKAQLYAERYRATKRPASEKAQRVKLSTELSAEQDAPGLIARTTIADVYNGLTSRVKAAHVDAYKKGERDSELTQSIIDALDEMSDMYLDRAAMEGARSAVVGGRYAALEELQEEIRSYARSEAMDQNTCEACQAGDGDEWESLDDVSWSPGDDCEGADACRGQLMPIFADEGTVQLE